MRTKDQILASETGLANADDYEAMRLAVEAAQSSANNAVAVMWSAADQTAMLALSNAKKGHFAKRSDVQGGVKWIYILNQLPATEIANWSPFAIWYTEGGGTPLVNPVTLCGDFNSTSMALYPTTGGTGTDGAIKAGNAFKNTGNGWLGRCLLIAAIDDPGTNGDNWIVQQDNLGYAPVNVASRKSTVEPSSTDFPNNDAVIAYVASQLSALIGTLGEASSTKYVAVNELIEALNLKADINYVHGLLKGFAWKDNVRAATTANITLSGTQTIDGVSLSVDDRVIVKNQTDATQNGIYLVKAGAWVRADDADNAAELRGATANVLEGSTNGDKQFSVTTDSIVLGSSNIVFKETGGAATFAGLIGSPSDNSSLAAALSAKANNRDTIVDLDGDFTLNNLNQLYAERRITSSVARTITVPSSSSLPGLQIGDWFDVCQSGTGQVSWVAGAGATVNAADSATKVRTRYGMVRFKYVAVDTWRAIGDITV